MFAARRGVNRGFELGSCGIGATRGGTKGQRDEGRGRCSAGPATAGKPGSSRTLHGEYTRTFSRVRFRIFDGRGSDSPHPRPSPKGRGRKAARSRFAVLMTLTPCKLRSLAVAVLIRRSQRVRSSCANNSGGARVCVVVTETGCGAHP
jgi:hypothetical protein